MANKQKKKRNKKYRPKYVTGGRVDYSKGGRVSLAHGGKPVKPIRRDYPAGYGGNYSFNQAMGVYNQQLAAWEAEHDAIKEQEEKTQEFQSERSDRVMQTGQQAEQIAAGDFSSTDLPTIPEAKTLIDPETGLPSPTTELDAASQAFKMQQTPSALTLGVKKGSKEQVAQASTAQAEDTKVDEAAQITQDELTTVADEDVAVDKATGDVTREAQLADQTLTERAVAADISDAEAAKGMAQQVTGKVETEAERLDRRTAETVEDVKKAEADTREAKVISGAEKAAILSNITEQGVDIEKLPNYELVKQRTAQVAEANTKIAQDLGEAPSRDAAMRAGITSDGVAKGNAAQIGGIPTFEAASRQAVTKEARKEAAADMLLVVGDMPKEVTAAVIEDPATVEAQLDTAPVNVQAAVAALPQEALVSTQMEGLLAGIEENKTPVWARPAVDAVNQMMAQRGLSASTVGRDALFNAIIQSALPIAQSNAQALQARAAQNLSNEQQANLQQANQVMQQRMTNLANQQTAASQTAQMAQQVVLKQGEFDQQAVMTTAQQEQQVRMTNIQNEQQKASQESSQRQQMALANLDVGSKMDLANLEQINAANRESMSADQQGRLAEYQAKVNRTMRQAELNQRMEEVNLDSRLKVELANLAELNTTNRASMSNDQQMRLANLNVLVDFKKTNANLAQQMDLANMSAENQMELAMLQDRAAADSANFTEANKFRLQELTTTASFLSQNAEIRQRAEMAKLGSEEKIALANLTAKNQADSESMTAENQMELANLNKRMAAAQTNAQLAQQLGLAELSNDQQAAMFNAQIGANMDMANFNVEQQRELSNSKFMQTVQIQNMNAEQQAALQNATAMASLDLANLSTQERLQVENAKNFLAMDMANLSNEQQSNILKAQQEQQRLLSDQAAQNAAAQFNATSENQINQFMANLAQNNKQFNIGQLNSMEQFNKQALNVAEARRVGNEAEANKLEAQIRADISKFNSQLSFQREEFNTKNETTIAQSNVAWRRQANTADTAAQNAINQQNAQNAFGLTASAMNFLWQELRDEADFNFRRWDNEQTRKTSIYTAALGNDTAASTESNWSTNLSAISTLIQGWLE